MAAVRVGDPDLIEEREGETAPIRRPRRILHAATACVRRLDDPGPRGRPADEGGDGNGRRDAAQAPGRGPRTSEPANPRVSDHARAAVRLRFTASTTCRAEMPNLSTSSS